MNQQATAVEALRDGRVNLGVEFGSTRIKACLVLANDATTVLATGHTDWENQYIERTWTYSLDEVWSNLQTAYSNLSDDVSSRYGVTLKSVAAIGVSAMMHGYLAFNAAGNLLTPFRTWRNSNTHAAAAELTQLFQKNVPVRWSIAHLHQAMLNDETHVAHLDFITTLAGYVHWKLTGNRVLGVGDASGMFPVDPVTNQYDARLMDRFENLPSSRKHHIRVSELLPDVLVAGQPAGELTVEGAALLDPTGMLQPGSTLCPPEGDAGTGMVATCTVAKRTGNVSVGTSIFAMVVLERPLANVHHGIDIVTTPTGNEVAMVHCNNGASELAAWAGIFERFNKAAGGQLGSDEVFELLFNEASSADPDAGGLLTYNYLAGEPIVGLAEGRPVIVRGPDSLLTLANFMRAQLYGVFGTLAIGMRALATENVVLDRLFAHGGVFRTAGTAQRFLAGALNVPVAVTDSASEGGAWGAAVLATYLSNAEHTDLDTYLRTRVFANTTVRTTDPDPEDVRGFNDFLSRFRAGLGIQGAAIAAL